MLTDTTEEYYTGLMKETPIFDVLQGRYTYWPI